MVTGPGEQQWFQLERRKVQEIEADGTLMRKKYFTMGIERMTFVRLRDGESLPRYWKSYLSDMRC